jgi:hypothetical protein
MLWRVRIITDTREPEEPGHPLIGSVAPIRNPPKKVIRPARRNRLDLMFRPALQQDFHAIDNVL